MIKKVDLHMHTLVSDGTDSPIELLSKVKEAGIDLFAITDHDACSGCFDIIENKKEEYPKFLTGIEFSCKDGEGKYHILGYGYDPNAQAMQHIIETGHNYRIEKTYARMDFLKEEYGFTFPQEEIDMLFQNNNPGKPHIGNLMVKYGYANTKNEAIDNYINNCTYKSRYVNPEMAIRAIIESGGIPILAHPSYGNGSQLIIGEEMEQRIIRLMEFGLKGLEVYYSGFTNKLMNELLRYADKYDLYVTAGSDYHGKNKLVELGDNNLESVDEAVEGLHRFIHDISASMK